MRKSPLRPVSAKRQRENVEFAKVREAAFERDDHLCQLAVRLNRADLSVKHECRGALHPHHIVPVGRDMTLRLELANIATVCAWGHDWIHSHPVPATLLGLLKSAS